MATAAGPARVAASDPAVIERLLPVGVAVVEARSDADVDGLFPEELALIATAAAKRRAEFATVRRCARQALFELGVPSAAILPGDRGAPRWPEGLVGSMTHCRAYRAAAVARSTELAALGIDAELHQPLPPGVLDLIARPEERRQLTELGGARHWETLLFSIKEAVYKTWFPLTGEWLDFDSVSVELRPDQQRFRAGLQVPGPVVDGAELAAFDGCFSIESGLVLAAVAVPRAGRSGVDQRSGRC